MYMLDYNNDSRIVMTLDAGGTNFVFSAIQGNREIVAPVNLPSHARNLELCLQTVLKGFTMVRDALEKQPVAISFAFPGPSDFPNGIIGDLGNLPAFRGGVALGPMLEDHFRIPFFVNNDGDLFAYGEAIAGFLPEINRKLSEAGSPKRFNNLLGVTLGTGFGGGLVTDGRLYLGDNSAGLEIWLLRDKLHGQCNIEESASIRAVQRVYMEQAGLMTDKPPTPKDIFEIALGECEGNRDAALKAWHVMGVAVGDALANAVTITDSLVVIGGGLAGAHKLFLPGVVEEMNSSLETMGGDKIDRMEIRAFNLEDPAELEQFLKGKATKVKVPGSGRLVDYDPMKRTGVGISKLGTSKATAIGAYVYALNKMDE
jgi:glucokinase